jgi:hypothetical protein
MSRSAPRLPALGRLFVLFAVVAFLFGAVGVAYADDPPEPPASPVLVDPENGDTLEAGSLAFQFELESEGLWITAQLATSATFAEESILCDMGWESVGFHIYWMYPVDPENCSPGGAFEPSGLYFVRARVATADPEMEPQEAVFSEWTEPYTFWIWGPIVGGGFGSESPQ